MEGNDSDVSVGAVESACPPVSVIDVGAPRAESSEEV